MPSLPPEILLIICTQLSNQRDFKTLFNCACSGKKLALPALSQIYGMHNGSDIEQQQHGFCKSRMGTIIRSSLGKTMYPYCRYLRTFNLGELEEFLRDLNSFDLWVPSLFFQDERADLEVKTDLRNPGRSAVDIVGTTNRIRAGIIKQTPMLEELTGNVTNRALLQWIPGLSRLRHLNWWHCSSLAGAGKLIRAHCPLFRSLKFRFWTDREADHQLATFLRDIRPQSLQSFEFFCYSEIGPESLQALDWHRETLSELILTYPKRDASPALPVLKGCTNIVSLSLQGSDPRSLSNNEHEGTDVIRETIAWLRECKKLRALSFTYFGNSFAITIPILLDNTIPLTRLEVNGYPMLSCKGFYRALASKTSLKSLSLAGFAMEQGDEASEILIDSLCKLVNLEDLGLQDFTVSDYFGNHAIMRLARSLSKLESWWNSGFLLGDVIWDDIAALKSLRRLDFVTTTKFTVEGILGFVSKLGPGNKGFSLDVLMPDRNYGLSTEEISLIREKLAEKVDGIFEFGH